MVYQVKVPNKRHSTRNMTNTSAKLNESSADTTSATLLHCTPILLPSKVIMILVAIPRHDVGSKQIDALALLQWSSTET